MLHLTSAPSRSGGAVGSESRGVSRHSKKARAQSMDWGLHGRVVIVTGGSAGIGRAVAKVFARQGARTVIAARRLEALKAAAQDIERDTGQQVLAVSADTTVQEQVDQLVARVMT